MRGTGVEPARLAAQAPQACMATITSPAHYFISSVVVSVVIGIAAAKSFFFNLAFLPLVVLK